MQNLFTVDLEDWYCTRVMGRVISRSEWDQCESRVRIGTERLLQLLQDLNVEATFFVLGYVAEREPDLVLKIAEGGHEIATHGYFHRSLTTLTRDQFRRDIEHSIEVLQKITGVPVLGHRAPDFSMTEVAGDWAFDVLRDCGIVYDSSIFPAWWRSQKQSLNRNLSMNIYHQSNGMIEMPISCVEILGVPFPATGGAYFRHTPFEVTRLLIERCNRLGRGSMFYIHPWELDPGQPKVDLPLLQRMRHYRGIDTMYEKIERLLCDFSFTSVRSMLKKGSEEKVKILPAFL